MKFEALSLLGFGELKVHVRILKNGRKEVILSFGKEYRFVLKPFGDAQGKPAGNPVTRSSSKASYGEVIPQGGK